MSEQTSAAGKKRYDYTKIGLSKTDDGNGHDVTVFNGKGIKDMTPETVTSIANYGLFVILTRSLAGHEKETDNEKKAIVQKEMDWLLAGMPKRERKSGPSADEIREALYQQMRDGVKDGSAKEKKMVEDMIEKMKAANPPKK